jgi:antitoxin CptB
MDHSHTDIRLKRLMLRSWRRGMKEMDIILGGYADAKLASLEDKTLTLYEEMLEENDQLLYRWITKPDLDDSPEKYGRLFQNIRDFHGIIVQAGSGVTDQ